MSAKMTDYLFLPEGRLMGSEENTYYTGSLRRLERAMREGVILEGTVSRCDCSNMELSVDVGEYRGVIPREEAAWTQNGEKVKDIAIITRVGKHVAFKVTDIVMCGGEPTLVLSRREAQKECFERYVSHLTPGDVIEGCVTHLEPFGAFVDIGCGIVSLLTVDAISVSRISHPRDRFRCGSRILCVVRSVEDGRIYLTHRELLGTWEENARLFSPAQTVTGVVRSVEDYGIFVELAPNLAGLAEYKEGFEVGDVCAVYIKSIIPEKMKIKLVLIGPVASSAEAGTPLRYSGGTAGEHISYWRYSPDCSIRRIESVFD